MSAAVASVWIVVGACALLVSLWLWFTTDTRMNRLEDNQHHHDAPPVEATVIPAPRVGGQHRTKANR